MIRPPFESGWMKRVDERLIVEADLAARGIARVVALERPETVDEPIGLRPVVVGQDRQIPPEHIDIRVVVSMASPVVIRPIDARDLHRLGAAGELPEQLVAAAERIRGARRRFGPQAYS